MELKFTAIITAFATLAFVAFFKEVIKMAIEANIGFTAFGGSIGAEGKVAFL